MVQFGEPQRMPDPGQQDVTEQLINWLRQRQQYGIAKYGQSLMTFDGRDKRVDAVQELLDGLQYLYGENLELKYLLRQALPFVYEIGLRGQLLARIEVNAPQESDEQGSKP